MKQVRSDKRNWGWARLRAGASFTSSPMPSTPVILSGVNASRSEAVTQSKDPYSQIEAEACGQLFAVNPEDSEFCSTERGPSTPAVHSEANEQPPLRMTGLRDYAVCVSSAVLLPVPSIPVLLMPSVILSGVNASRSEAVTQSKHPYRQIGAEACGQSFAVNPEDSEFRSADRGPSTAAVHSQANEQPPLRMTTGSYCDEIHAPDVVRSLLKAVESCMSVFTAVLREIFDESAYARFLNQRHLPSSRSAYAAFRQEHEISKARQPRCC
jgi:hypothetical protein